jgi:hypothetical protein
MRIVLAIMAALLAGGLWWPIALRQSAYIVSSDMWRPGYLFAFLALGSGLVLLAGWRWCVLCWLWPLLFYAASVAYIQLTFETMSPVDPGRVPIFLTFVGCLIGVLWLGHRAKRAAAPPLWNDR